MDRTLEDKLESNINSLRYELDNIYMNGITNEMRELATRICELIGSHTIGFNDLRTSLEACRALNDDLRLENTKLRAQLKTCQDISLGKSNQYRRLRNTGEGLKEANEEIQKCLKHFYDADGKIKPQFEDVAGILYVMGSVTASALSVWHEETNSNEEDEPGYAEMQYQAHVDL